MVNQKWIADYNKAFGKVNKASAQYGQLWKSNETVFDKKLKRHHIIPVQWYVKQEIASMSTEAYKTSVRIFGSEQALKDHIEESIRSGKYRTKNGFNPDDDCNIVYLSDDNHNLAHSLICACASDDWEPTRKGTQMYPTETEEITSSDSDDEKKRLSETFRNHPGIQEDECFKVTDKKTGEVVAKLDTVQDVSEFLWSKGSSNDRAGYDVEYDLKWNEINHVKPPCTFGYIIERAKKEGE